MKLWCAFAFAWMFARPVAAAASNDPSPWQPGHVTSSKLPGEVKAPRERETDGVYGRFDGELAVTLSGGPLFELAGDPTRIHLGTSFFYLYTFGLSLGYSEALTAAKAGERKRLLALGIELRPLFLPRWSLDLEQGPALLDLALDSFAVGFGGYAAAESGRALGDDGGLWLSAELAVPLLLEAPGPWLSLRGLYTFIGDDRLSMIVALGWQAFFDF